MEAKRLHIYTAFQPGARFEASGLPGLPEPPAALQQRIPSYRILGVAHL